MTDADRTYIFVGPGAMASFASGLLGSKFDAGCVALIDRLASTLAEESGVKTEIIFASEAAARFRSVLYGRYDEVPKLLRYGQPDDLHDAALWDALAAWAQPRGNIVGLWLGSQRYQGGVEMGVLETDRLNGFTGRDYQALLAALDIRDGELGDPAAPPGEQSLSLTPSFISRHNRHDGPRSRRERNISNASRTWTP